ncbi:MAG: signal recognition particle protein Srp19 [Candidatus Thermoplasmatota archaeon]|nr:signal recognition particle protein Srp19 [Candidatus Thermoplasmatota archaeon]
MVSRDEEKYVVWPSYFDKTRSRLQGRKVAKKHAIEKPTIEAIAKAAKTLGLNPIVEKERAYPANHWKKTGRVIVDKKEAKSKLLVKIANRL